MKKNKIAFTMIELIVVSLIIVLLGTGSVFYFFDFTDNRELITYVDILQDDIDDLDKQVKNYQVSDYVLYFLTGANYYTGSINNLGTHSLVRLSVNDDGSANFNVLSGTGSLVWNYIIYENDKEIATKITSDNQLQTFDFDLNKNYMIQGYVGGNATNTVFVKNLYSSGSGLELSGVSESGIFSNKNNIKTNIDLTFTKGGSTQTLELK